jgi:hypothetical protein
VEPEPIPVPDANAEPTKLPVSVLVAYLPVRDPVYRDPIVAVEEATGKAAVEAAVRYPTPDRY